VIRGNTKVGFRTCFRHPFRTPFCAGGDRYLDRGDTPVIQLHWRQGSQSRVGFESRLSGVEAIARSALVEHPFDPTGVFILRPSLGIAPLRFWAGTTAKARSA